MYRMNYFLVPVLLVTAICVIGAEASASQPRSRVSFNDDWQFHKLDHKAGLEKIEDMVSDSSDWQSLTLPHDWGIEGPFTQEVPSAEGRLPFPGVGWYYKRFEASPKGKKVFIEFDGVMRYAKVWLNGEYVGEWKYGYSSFTLELTPFLNHGEENVITVRCENEADSSRWYPGAGIYRNVWLTTVEPVHVAHWGTFVTTPEVSKRKASVQIQTEVQNQTDESKDVAVETTIVDAEGKELATIKATGKIDADSKKTFTQTIKIKNPILWDIENPYLYTAMTRVRVAREVTVATAASRSKAEVWMLIDEYKTPFGIRTFKFDAKKGFFLNGRNMKIQGVNLHHGLGPLGTAINRSAIERQLKIMRGMGCNAIRTAHNPPAPEFLDVCDEMGFLVMDEAFDEWLEPKAPNAYHLLFREWAERDMHAMLKRDRNHPSVILWSIGNEIVGLENKAGVKAAKRLAGICRELDPTRPASIGNSASYKRTKEAIKALDVVGWNYRPGTGPYDEPERIEIGMKQIATESSALVSSRGEYLFPVKQGINDQLNGQVSSYDLTNLSFGDLPDDEFKAQEEAPWVAGEFVWSGFDYLGEPEPCEFEETARSTYFGIVDMCGFPKDRYYLYQSHWTDEPMVHLLPHWSWAGREGEITPIFVYTNCDSAEVFVNGKSLGKKSKEKGVYRLRWNEVKYQPGSIKAVAYDKSGKTLCSKEIKTAAKPAGIELSCNQATIKSDGQDLLFITVKIVDEDGNFCPRADNLVNFKIDGPGKVAAVGNGNSMSFESFRADHRKAFNGLCLLVVRPGLKPGNIKVTAVSEGLKSTSLKISSAENKK